ncbi:hypothetical protein R1flu_012253 [Riccia fluitans]|uniref:Uncharacterized protein n=1 Tax=Riccia fluitans TaxID=41844 RepID=A0ABD1ZA58_9MARC
MEKHRNDMIHSRRKSSPQKVSTITPVVEKNGDVTIKIPSNLLRSSSRPSSSSPDEVNTRKKREIQAEDISPRISRSRSFSYDERAPFVVSPEDEFDALYRQLVTLKGQPVIRNPLCQVEPDVTPVDYCAQEQFPFGSPLSEVETTHTSTMLIGNERRRSNTSITMGSAASSSSLWAVTGQEENRNEERRNHQRQKRGEGGGPTTLGVPEVKETHRRELEKLQEKHFKMTSQLVRLEKDHTTNIHDVVESHRRELTRMEEKLLIATSQLTNVEKDHFKKGKTIRSLERKVEDYHHRINEVEQALNFLTVHSYQARLRDVYRKMFLECVRKKLRAKLRAWFKSPPCPVDYHLVSYDKVIKACEQVEELEKHLGLSREAVRLTSEDASTIRGGVHDNERIHIGIYAEMVHSQAPELAGALSPPSIEEGIRSFEAGESGLLVNQTMGLCFPLPGEVFFHFLRRCTFIESVGQAMTAEHRGPNQRGDMLSCTSAKWITRKIVVFA